MRKLLLTALILSLVVTSGAFASSARWQALGNEQRFIIDTSNYGTYPGRLHQFSNALFLMPRPAFGNDDFCAGFLLKLNDEMSGALHFNLASAETRGLASTLAGLGNDRLAGLELKTWPDLFWAMKMGTATIGVRGALAMASKSAGDVKTSASSTNLNVGATMDMADMGTLDLGAGLGLQSFSDDDGTTLTESAGGYSIALDARLYKPMKEKTTVVPVLNVNIGASPTVKDHTEVSSVGGDIGVGYQIMFDNTMGEKKMKDRLVLAGLVIGFKSVTQTPVEGDSVSTTTISPKFLAGCESQIFSWLTVRGGASAELAIKSNDIGSKSVSYYYNTGVRVQRGKYIIDAILARDIFHRGPSFISGSSSDSNGLMGNVCLVYAF